MRRARAKINHYPHPIIMTYSFPNGQEEILGCSAYLDLRWPLFRIHISWTFLRTISARCTFISFNRNQYITRTHRSLRPAALLLP
jgi:hypothetical protein